MPYPADDLFVVEALAQGPSCRTIWASEPLLVYEACALSNRMRDQALVCADGYDWPPESFYTVLRSYRPEDE